METPKEDAQQELASSPALGSDEGPPKQKLGWRFFIVFIALCVTMLLSALDATIITIALPTITRALGSTQYAWAVNSYTLSCAVFLLLIGQLADVFDRKPIMLASVFLFAAGSAICGAAVSMPMLLVGRVIQGIGGGGIPVMSELICSDMVTIDERPKYLGILLSTSALGTVIGPPVSGAIIGSTSWRWIFYINLPLSGAALVFLILVLRARDLPPETANRSFLSKLAHVDWIGNGLFAASTCSFLLGLLMGGNDHPWKSANVIVPLILGILGIVAFAFYEKFSGVQTPVLPPRLVDNFTSISLYIQGAGTVLYYAWVTYFLVVYFQAVLVQSPGRSSVELLPTIILPLPFAVVGGFLMARLKRVREIHLIASATMTIGLGCFSLFDAKTHLGVRVVLQIIVASGTGMLMSTLLPAVQSMLPESDVAAVTALFNFMRSLGGVWALTIPAVVFNARVNHELPTVHDPELQRTLADGGAYSQASKGFILSIPDDGRRAEVLNLYTKSLRVTWYVCAALSACGFFLAAFEKKIILRLEDPQEKEKKEKEKKKTKGEKSAEEIAHDEES